MLSVCLDESVVGRKEFVLPSCRSNRSLGMVGNAHMTTHLSVKCFVQRHSAQQLQELRNAQCSQAGKAGLYDVLFAGDVVFYWGFEEQQPEPSVRQKADFVDALVGLLFITGRWELSDWLCARIVDREN